MILLLHGVEIQWSLESCRDSVFIIRKLELKVGKM